MKKDVAELVALKNRIKGAVWLILALSGIISFLLYRGIGKMGLDQRAVLGADREMQTRTALAVGHDFGCLGRLFTERGDTFAVKRHESLRQRGKAQTLVAEQDFHHPATLDYTGRIEVDTSFASG